MIEYVGNSGVVIDTQRFLGINTPIVESNWGQGPNKLGNSNEALVVVSGHWYWSDGHTGTTNFCAQN